MTKSQLGKHSITKEALLLMAGIGICVYFIYIRLILERLPKDTITPVNPIALAIYGCLFTLFFILMRNHIKPRKAISPATEYLLNTILTPISTGYKKSLAMVYMLVNEHIPIQPPTHAIITRLGDFLQRRNLSLLALANTYIMANQVPRLVVLIALYVDVFLVHKYFYFYKLATLLVIPLVWNIILYLLDKQWANQMNWYTIFMEVEVTPGKIICSPKPSSELIRYYKPTEQDYWDITLSTRQYLSFQKLLLEKLEPGSVLFQLNRVYCLSLITYLGYTIIWADLFLAQLLQLL